MGSIARRIERAEERLGLGTGMGLVIHEIVHFGSGPLPPDERRGGIVVRHIRYEDIQAHARG